MELNFYWIPLLFRVLIPVILPFRCASQTTVAPENGSLRLANGTESAGRVEVYMDGEWGTVCDDNWSFEDALVACRQLGFAGALGAFREAYFRPGVGAIHLDDVQCRGYEESLSECSYNEEHNCNHFEDAGVVCSNYEYVEVRLVDGNGTSGHVELNLNGDWRRMCADDWGLVEADVVCRQIGLKGVLDAKNVSIDSTNGTEGFIGIPGNGNFLYEVGCHGNESSISRCRIGRTNSCVHYASVVCFPPEDGMVRLADGPHVSAGRVEVYQNGQWGTVCDNEWSLSAASVVCAQLGHRGAIAAPKYSHFGGGTGVIHLISVDCDGSERALLDCDYATGEVDYSFISDQADLCDHSEDASAICVSQDDGALRLVDGGDNSSGRVEVFLQGLWGTVCDDQFDIKDAIVVCRQLSFLGALKALDRAHFGVGTGFIHLDNVGCLATEESLLECSFLNRHNCGHQEDVGVVCVRQDEGQLRLVEGVDIYSGRVEIFINETWGRVCDGGWDLNDASVACHQLGFGRAVRHDDPFLSFGSGGSDFILGGLECGGNESDLVACPSDKADCHGANDATVVCESSSFGTDYPVRLMDDSTSFAGAVEVFFGGQWGTVCDSGWGIEDSSVVCNQLGYGDAINVSSRRVSSTLLQNRPILLSDVRCHGNETSLSECYFAFGNRISNVSCRHENDVYVVCANACLQHIRCPDDIVVTLETGTNRSDVTWPAQIVSGNPCGAVSVTSSHSPGDSFQESLTTVIYHFQDTSGRIAGCNFTVNITRDKEGDPDAEKDKMSSGFLLPVVLTSLLIFVVVLAVCAVWLRAPFCKSLRRRPLPARPDILITDSNPSYLFTTKDSIKDNANPLPRPDILFTSVNPAYLPTTKGSIKDHEEGIYDIIPGGSNTENSYYITPIAAERKTSTVGTVSLSSLSSLGTDQRLGDGRVLHVENPYGGDGDLLGLSNDTSTDKRLRKKESSGVVRDKETDYLWRKQNRKVMSCVTDPGNHNNPMSTNRSDVAVTPGTSFADNDPYCIYASRIDDREGGIDTRIPDGEVRDKVEPLSRARQGTRESSDEPKETRTENPGSLREGGVFILEIGSF